MFAASCEVPHSGHCRNSDQRRVYGRIVHIPVPFLADWTRLYGMRESPQQAYKELFPHSLRTDDLVTNPREVCSVLCGL